MKAKQKPKYEYMAVHLPRNTKKRVRAIAAEMETSMGRASEKLLELGLDEYLKKTQTPAVAE
ncbi:hypothetical protein LQZ19_08480 [Treponema primitia]|uniref:hypothetical protein n=1 Tax=Treponema primitia TaxID=88058 RepID=UPI00397EE9E3